MGQPVFYLLAGPNGAGKSTLYRALVPNGDFQYLKKALQSDYWSTAKHASC